MSRLKALIDSLAYLINSISGFEDTSFGLWTLRILGATLIGGGFGTIMKWGLKPKWFKGSHAYLLCVAAGIYFAWLDMAPGDHIKDTLKVASVCVGASAIIMAVTHLACDYIMLRIAILKKKLGTKPKPKVAK